MENFIKDLKFILIYLVVILIVLGIPIYLTGHFHNFLFLLTILLTFPIGTSFIRKCLEW